MEHCQADRLLLWRLCMGLETWPHPLSVVEWIDILLRREELEYTLPDEAEPYVAAKVNRFRCSWQVLHLMHSFWRVTETTKSVHAALKTPGTFAFARRRLPTILGVDGFAN